MTSPWPGTTALAEYQSGDPQAALDAAISLIQGYCGWHIAPSRDDDVVLDGSGHYIQSLPTLMLTAITDVVDDDVALTDDDYDWSEDGYMIRVTTSTLSQSTNARGWTYKLRSVTATITHGYAELPGELYSAALVIATLAQTPASAITSQTAGPYSIQMATRSDGVPVGIYLPNDIRSILDKYKIQGVA
mgnify:CR=1 FL=1